MVSIILSVLASIISGMVLFFLQHFFKKKAKQDEKREEIAHKKDILVIKSINAIGELTHANSVALRDGKTNGKMKKAMDLYEEANKEMLDFLIENSTDGGNDKC